MLAPVVFDKKSFEAPVEFHHGFVSPDVDVVVFDRAPETFNHHVVQGPAFTVHADFYPMGFENPCEGFTGKLATLIRIENLRASFLLECFIKAFYAERLVQTVAEAPAYDVTARPVHDRCQVNVRVTQRDIGNVGAPDLVAALYFKIAQQVGVDLVTLAGLAQAGFGINRLDTHLAHESFNPAARHLVVELRQGVTDAAGTEGRLLHVDSVNELHEQLVLQTRVFQRFVVVARLRHSQQLALFCDTHFLLLSN